MRICAYEKCETKEFEPATHNQKYCSDEHCRMATNDRLMAQYYERKARKQGKPRICETPGCNTKMSRYNEGKVCQKCLAEREAAVRAKLLRIFAA